MLENLPIWFSFDPKDLNQIFHVKWRLSLWLIWKFRSVERQFSFPKDFSDVEYQSECLGFLVI